MREYALITERVVDTYEYGLLAFTPGEQVRVVARAICGPEARTLVTCEAGLTFHVEDEGSLMHDTYPEPLSHKEDILDRLRREARDEAERIDPIVADRRPRHLRRPNG